MLNLATHSTFKNRHNCLILSKNKTIQLFKSLTAAERPAFDFVIKNHKRQALKIIFDSLSATIEKGGDIIDKANLFSTLYDTPYTPEKDYLLRNEMRLFSIELNNFVSLKQVEKNLMKSNGKKSLYYLQALLDRQLYELFEREVEKHLKKVIGEKDFENAAKINGLLMDYYRNDKVGTPNNFKKLAEIINNALMYLEKAFLQDWYENKLYAAFVQLNLNAFGMATYPLISLDFDMDKNFAPEVADEPYLRYIKFKTHFLCEREPNEKRRYFEKLLELQQRITKKGFDIVGERYKLYTNIGLNCFLHRNYEQSAVYYEKASETAPKKEKTLPILVFNYISVLLHLKNYGSALRVMEQHHKVLASDDRTKYNYLSIRSMCHIFLDQTEQAENCLPNINKAPNTPTVFYLRLIIGIVHFLQGNDELAITEVNNTIQAIRYNKKITSEAKASIAYGLLLKRYFLLNSTTTNSNKFQNAISALHTDVKKFVEAFYPQQFLPLPIQWLAKRLEEQTALKP